MKKNESHSGFLRVTDYEEDLASDEFDDTWNDCLNDM